MTRAGLLLAVAYIALILMAASYAFSGPAAAQSLCALRAEIVANLAMAYGEHLTNGGLQSANGVIEVWTSAEKNTWTILLTRPDGISCFIATGTDWVVHKAPLPGVKG